MNYFVVGGGGYVGYHIAVDLIKKDYSVVSYDVSTPDPDWIEDAEKDIEFVNKKHNLTFIKGNILSEKSLTESMMGSNVVVHCASYGLSGAEQLDKSKLEAINIQGTKNVISAAIASGVQALVYTSTKNVVYGGDKIIDGDETLPYFPIHRYIDHYSRTKSIAEQLVLASDGRKTKYEGKYLRTCALRLATVFGLNEKKHLPRAISNRIAFKFRFGHGKALLDWVGIENVVQAHVKASKRLWEDQEVLGGQAYFISDGKPLNAFDFYEPILRSVGCRIFKKKFVPVWMVWSFAYMILFFHSLMKGILEFDPLLTPNEVNTIVTTHYFKNDKAFRDFNYIPQNPTDRSKICEYYANKYKKSLDSKV